MARFAELDNESLLREYRQSVKRLEDLDPALPKAMHDIRAKYRDYIGQMLAARGLLTTNMDRTPG